MTITKLLNKVENALIENRLKKIALKLNAGRVIDWENPHQEKFNLGFNYDVLEVDFMVNTTGKHQGSIFCLDPNFLNVAVEEIGENRLAKYLRG